MKKLWLLLVSIVLCFVACDMPATGGNPGEGECSYIMKEHGIMTNFIRIVCPFDSICDVKFSFGPVAVPDDYGCVAGFEYKFVQENEIKIVKKIIFIQSLIKTLVLIWFLIRINAQVYPLSIQTTLKRNTTSTFLE